RKPYLDTGSSGLPMLLKYLVEDAERADLLFDCLNRTERPGYGYFLSQGATTWPEYWNMDHDSQIHTCYTGISGVFTKAIGGIRPDPEAWGMKQCIIKPQLVGDLTWANTTSGTYYGEIVSNWKRDGSVATFKIELPVNTTAKVFIPASTVEDVKESGRPTTDAAGVTYLGKNGVYQVFRVESGSYEFTSMSAPAVK
ncbi:MAG: hypothetical protein KJO79_08395, partial [Verrucomicrobiae bacterium]|nr:hypothetical protein [Verrucomicrobiae bacterium]NNJ87186.1 hypothetical protein [Akkermansiaceae bacterium]